MSLRVKLLAGLILGAFFLTGLAISGRLAPSQPASGPAAAPAPVQAPQAPSRAAIAAAGALPDLSSIAERALKVSVSISSTSTTVIDDPWMRFFYGRDLEEKSQQLGSGVVVSSDGYILTNTHVIGTSARPDVRVTLSDGREYRARSIGFDDVTDLAVVKIDARNLETLPWGDSSRLRAAEWVLAIGNPFNLTGTVTLGIVSTPSRTGSELGTFRDFIQTDAAVNPGNSGGALVNARGELVGINSMIRSDTGGYQGISFAIPSNVARDIMQQLVQHGEVRYGSIGRIRWQPIDRATARYNGLGDVEGLMVDSIGRTASAYRAGLRPGDIVTAFNGQKTVDPDQITRLIWSSQIGSTARLDVVRDGRRVTISVPVAAR